MPYLKTEDKPYIQWEIASTPGELNFLFTEIIKAYWGQSGDYQGINDIIGALEGAKLEFYRRIVGPYENQKIHDNGDVYDNPK